MSHWVVREVENVVRPLWKAAVRGAAIVALAVIHHYVLVGLEKFLGNGFVSLEQGIELFTSGTFGLIVAFQLYEIIVAFVPKTERSADANYS